MKIVIAAVFAALCLLTSARITVAQDVTITSTDGSIEVSGNLIGFDGDFYRIDTVYGELTIDSSGVKCEGPACPNLETYIAHLAFSGSPAIGKILLPALIEGYARQSGLVAVREELGESSLGYWLQAQDGSSSVAHFTINMTSSDEGFADLLARNADVAMAVRVVTPEESRLAEEAGLGPLTSGRQQAFLGLDALAVVVPKSSTISVLGDSAVEKLLSGEISDWQELGVPDAAPIKLATATGTRELIRELSVLPMTDSTEHLPEFGQHPNSLAAGISFLSSPPEDMRAISRLSDCGIIRDPTKLAVRSGEVPNVFPLVLYRPARRLPEAGQDFFDFLESPAGQRVVLRAGYVQATPKLYPFETIWYRLTNAVLQAETIEQFEALKRAIAILKPRELFGGALRFESEGNGLDAQSLALLRQLVQMVERGETDGRELLFVGFGGKKGSAEKVQQVFAKDLEALSVSAKSAWVDVGDTIPLACPDAPNAEVLNNRVEVWLR